MLKGRLTNEAVAPFFALPEVGQPGYLDYIKKREKTDMTICVGVMRIGSIRER